MNGLSKFLSFRKSFSARLSLYIIALTAILFITSIMIVSHYSHKLIRGEAITNANSILKGVNLEIENVLTSVSVAVDNLAEDVRRSAMKGEDFQSEMFDITRHIVKQNEHVVGSIVAFEPYFYPSHKYFAAYSFKGKDSIFTSQVGNDDYDYQYMEWFQIPKLLRTPYWSDPYFDEGAGNIMMCTYSHPLFDDEGNYFGVVTADLPTEWLTSMVNSIKPYKSSYNLMIGKGGAYIVHTDPERILNETIFTATMEMTDTTVRYLGREMVKGRSGMVTLQNDDTLSFVFYAPVPSSKWSLAIVCPHRDVFEGVRSMNKILITVMVLGLLLIFVLSILIVRRLAKPLTEFASSARDIAKGNFNSPLPNIRTQDEMRALKDSFGYMQTSLTSYIEELKNTTSAKERIESELNIAREIQMGMIPKIFPPFPDRKDIDLYAMLRPAKEVGGDLYDFFINDEKLIFAIGDVSGKGVPASLFMAVTRSLFRSIATTERDPSKIVMSMNGAVSETNEANMFVTIFVGILDLKSGELNFCNAGHNPPALLIRENGVTKAQFMDIIPNLPVGLFDGFAYQSQSIKLQNGSTLFMFTDGLTEAENPDKELYSEKRLLDTLGQFEDIDTEAMIRKTLQSVEEHVAGALQSDDLTMLVVKYSSVDSGHSAMASRVLVIENKVSDLTLLTQFIEKIGEDDGLKMSLVSSLTLAMEEAVSNVVFYAYPKGESGKITIEFCKRGKEIEFVIKDNGTPFDPTAVAEADITLSAEDRGIGGLGIFLVKQIMDTVIYTRENNMNNLRMTKILK